MDETGYWLTNYRHPIMHWNIKNGSKQYRNEVNLPGNQKSNSTNDETCITQ